MDLAAARLGPTGDQDAACEALRSAMTVGEDLKSEVVSRRAKQVLAVTLTCKHGSQLAATADAFRSQWTLNDH
jgi:hypothetical protein